MTIGQNSVGGNFTATATDPIFALGTRMKGAAGAEWMYVQANGAITGPGYSCIVDETFQAAMVSTSNDAGGDLIAVAGVAFADDEYGWLQVAGACDLRVSASCAANVRINTTATAGQLDDDGTSGAFAVTGMILTTARSGSAGLAPAFLNYPQMALAAI